MAQELKEEIINKLELNVNNLKKTVEDFTIVESTNSNLHVEVIIKFR